MIKNNDEYRSDLNMGMVYLVGAGPGDPELLTLKAKNVLQEADVIIYDSLISEEILSFAKDGCEVIYVGKRSSNHSLPQYSINELLSKKAVENKIVVRLKGGDPYLFGRGGEEAERLFEDAIPFEIIPGISSSFAVPAYAGIPLTHRDYASTVAIVTGHEGEHKEKSTINWDKLVGADTIVVLMGYKNLSSITKNIIHSGRDQETPCAVIQEGTTPNQKTAIGTLKTIKDETERLGLKSPLILIVGNVVKLKDTLNWFEKQPLRGLRVIVTRSEGQAGVLSQRLKRLGAFVISLPLIKVIKDGAHIDKARIYNVVQNIEDYDYIIFTSVNGVSGFLDDCFSKGFDARRFYGKKIVSVGKNTSLELKKYGIIPDIIPSEFSQSGIINSLKNIKLTGKKILFPQAWKINNELPAFLASSGAILENLPVYETIVPEKSREELYEIFSSLINIKESSIKKVHRNIGLPGDFSLSSLVISFTSYSTVENFVNLIKDIQEDFLTVIIKSGVKFASIGEKTAKYALGFGIKSDIIPEEVSIVSLVDEIVIFYKTHRD